MRKRRKMNLILIIFVLVLVLGLGYAYLTTTLSINGTTDVDSNTWNVYWDNVQVTSGSVTGAQVTTAPTIDTDKTTVSFRVNLKQPGEFYEFTVDAKNTGTIDAMIDTINKTTNIPDYLRYTITYSDDIEITGNQLLAANSKETYKVRVEYRTDINASSLPSSSESTSLSFGVTYVQANASSTPVRTELYSIRGATFTIGQNLPTGVTTYDNYQNAIVAYGYPYFLKQIVSNNLVNSSYVGFVLNNNVYYLRGAGATYNESTSFYNFDSPYYEENKSTLQAAFGSSNCSETITEYKHNYYCYDPNTSISANASADGGAAARYGVPGGGQQECFVGSGGISSCDLGPVY